MEETFLRHEDCPETEGPFLRYRTLPRRRVLSEVWTSSLRNQDSLRHGRIRGQEFFLRYYVPLRSGSPSRGTGPFPRSRDLLKTQELFLRYRSSLCRTEEDSPEVWGSFLRSFVSIGESRSGFRGESTVSTTTVTGEDPGAPGRGGRATTYRPLVSGPGPEVYPGAPVRTVLPRRPSGVTGVTRIRFTTLTSSSTGPRGVFVFRPAVTDVIPTVPCSSFRSPRCTHPSSRPPPATHDRPPLSLHPESLRFGTLGSVSTSESPKET